MASSFGQKLKKLRQENNLTQAEMAERLCVDPSRISRWEHGEEPSRRVLEQLQKVFHVNAYALLSDPAASDSEGPPASAASPPAEDAVSEEESIWRSKVVELFSQMTDLMEALTSRYGRKGGGALTN
ncbi:MAG: helix-turn-helix transcriptional regulator [Flavobacteriales bacterium]